MNLGMVGLGRMRARTWWERLASTATRVETYARTNPERTPNRWSKLATKLPAAARRG
jgi:hypothetical protein